MIPWEGLAALITAISSTGGIAALWKLYQARVAAAVAQGRKDLLAEQAQATIVAVTEELDDVKSENRRLWGLLEGLTA